MSRTLYFSGRAESADAAVTFLELAQESANRQKLIADRSGDQLVIKLNSEADDVIIELDKRGLFEGTMKPSTENPEPDLRAVATVFAETHRHLDAFLLVDDNSNTLFEHGNVLAMEALLDEALEKQAAADMVLDEADLGPLDTKWFTNTRVFAQGKELILQISLDAKSRINDKEWSKLAAGVGTLRGVTAAVSAAETLGFQLTVSSPTDDDSRRLAIASSFMVDDAIAATRDSDKPSPKRK